MGPFTGLLRAIFWHLADKVLEIHAKLGPSWNSWDSILVVGAGDPCENGQGSLHV